MIIITNLYKIRISLNHSRARVLKIKAWLLILVDFNIGDFILKSPIANIYSPPIFHLIRYPISKIVEILEGRYSLLTQLNRFDFRPFTFVKS